MQVKKHVLREISNPVPVPLATLGYRDFSANEDWYHNLISTTSVMWHPERQRVVCGLTSFDTDIVYEFDPATSEFHSLDYPSVSEKFEIKVHRSLALTSNGSVYGATAGLHREDQRHEAQGGRIFQYDFDKREYDILGIPVPPDYVQTITLDEQRGLIYGVTYPAFTFFAFDIEKRRTRYQHYVGSVPHIMALDDDGCPWSTWSPRTHNLFKYNPDSNKMHFYNHGIPRSQGEAGIMFPGAGPVDTMLNGGDGYIYVGVTTGELVRIEPKSAQVEYLGKPSPETRLAALTLDPHGRLWGICGFLGRCRLFAYDRATRTFEDYGHIKDEESSIPIFIAHDMCFTSDSCIFVGETDTADRAGYLWEIQL